MLSAKLRAPDSGSWSDILSVSWHSLSERNFLNPRLPSTVQGVVRSYTGFVAQANTVLQLVLKIARIGAELFRLSHDTHFRNDYPA